MRDASFTTQAEAEARFEAAMAELEPREAQTSHVVWYGQEEPEPPPWLISGVLPRTQVAILAGQYSAGKTFVAINLALSVMTGRPFIGAEVESPGGCLWLAAEGRADVLSRLKAAALDMTGDDMAGKLPFALQLGAVPTLTEPDAFERLKQIVIECMMKSPEDMELSAELSIIVIDTLGSAAGFVDENNAAETQRVFNMLRKLSDFSGALVLVVDHFGKAAETGVRGSSAKAAAADAILAVMAKKAPDGSISDRSLVIEKLRQAETGRAIPFRLKAVEVNGWGTTQAAVEWIAETTSAKASKIAVPAWAPSLRLFKAAMVHAMIDHGIEKRPFGFEGPKVKAVLLSQVKTEFHARYAADTQEAKQTQFRRNLKDAAGKALVASREIEGVDWLWFMNNEDVIDASSTSQAAEPTADTPF